MMTEQSFYTNEIPRFLFIVSVKILEENILISRIATQMMHSFHTAMWLL